MGRVLEGGGVLLLLSIFCAYLSAPASVAIRKRIRLDRRGRPVSTAGALAILYGAILIPTVAGLRLNADATTRWVEVTAPAAVDRLFGGRPAPLDRAVMSLPLPTAVREPLRERVFRFVGYIGRQVRALLHELIAAWPYAPWLIAAPVIAFTLLTGAPGFKRSALRVLPHGHLQWRGEEYLRDVNSAMAGYVRAQTAAALLVGTACVAGFVLMRLPSPIALGVTTGLFEFLPTLGPATAALMVLMQAGDKVWWVILFLGVVRVTQDYFIYPRLIRQGMHLSTPVVILSVWGGAAIAGAGGVILAMPVAGFVSVSLRHWREYRDIERLVREATLRMNADV